jgi:hypothetical protein
LPIAFNSVFHRKSGLGKGTTASIYYLSWPQSISPVPATAYLTFRQRRLNFNKKSASRNFDAPKAKGQPDRLPFVIEFFGGVEGDRTPDLMNAIHALSQLSYDP